MGRHPVFVVIAGGTQTTGRGRNYIFCCCPHTSYLSVSAICHEKMRNMVKTEGAINGQ